ncbi:MAG TPA: hypothetical protein PKW35_01035, partial [Nannocystaceae bacterium]|nr:hypothetical protein [Nannocystaceae bacterium]
LAASRPQDPVSALAWPVLDHSERPRVEKARRRGRGRERGGIRAEIHDAAECLATHERAQGNNLRTLQRAVQFGAAATLAYVQALIGDTPLDDRSPGLLVMSERRRSDLARASERSLERILDRFEDWLGDRVGALIDAGEPLIDGERPLTASEDVRTVTRVFQKINKKREKRQMIAPTDADVKQRIQFWREVKIRDESLSAGRRLGRALVLAHRREVEGTPREFVTALSRRAGLLFPPFGGRALQKRLKPSVLMLDTLVRACVPAGRILPLDEFLERLWRRFGLIVGGRRSPSWDDAELLERHDLHVDPHDLSSNTELFVDELASMGLARRFPDDVAFIGDGYDR